MEEKWGVRWELGYADGKLSPIWHQGWHKAKKCF